MVLKKGEDPVLTTVALSKSFTVLGVDLWVRVDVVHALNVDHDGLMTRNLICEVGEGLGGHSLLRVHISQIVVVLLVFSLQRHLNARQISVCSVRKWKKEEREREGEELGLFVTYFPGRSTNSTTAASIKSTSFGGFLSLKSFANLLFVCLNNNKNINSFSSLPPSFLRRDLLFGDGLHHGILEVGISVDIVEIELGHLVSGIPSSRVVQKTMHSSHATLCKGVLLHVHHHQ
jgi:hypothetical protein